MDMRQPGMQGSVHLREDFPLGQSKQPVYQRVPNEHKRAERRPSRAIPYNMQNSQRASGAEEETLRL